jgi:hypothetical protein
MWGLRSGMSALERECASGSNFIQHLNYLLVIHYKCDTISLGGEVGRSAAPTRLTVSVFHCAPLIFSASLIEAPSPRIEIK